MSNHNEISSFIWKVCDVREELFTSTDVSKVLNGDNSEDVKRDYFNRKVKDMIIDIYSDKFDLYKKLMNDQVFPQFVSYLYQSMGEQGRKGI